ncbi:MAG: DUF4143 domain-containing protein [Elusimicrobia bacterium]|nr:DUF4143 domain-containing protein [Elusimicrobiota bacterium]
MVPQRSKKILDRLLESLIVQHVRAWNAYRQKRNTLYYWRTRSGVEIDLIVYGQDGLWSFEIKNSAKISPQDLKGLEAFRDDYPESTPVLLYRGHDRRVINGIHCWPCDQFLKQLHPNKNLALDR